MKEHPCKECGEPTLNPDLCRECSTERLVADSSCERCGVFLFRAGLVEEGKPRHLPDCADADRCEWPGGCGHVGLATRPAGVTTDTVLTFNADAATKWICAEHRRRGGVA